MTEHWCREHKTVFFKKGNMRGYAHPITDAKGKPTGDWCNEPKEEEIPSEEIDEEPGEQTSSMTKEDWAKKDKITRKSIERQKSLELAVEMAKLFGADKTTLDKIIATAKQFEAYLEFGQEVKAKSKLIDEAKQMGAIEE